MPCQMRNGRASGHSHMSRSSGHRLSILIASTQSSPRPIASPITGYNGHQFIAHSTLPTFARLARRRPGRHADARASQLQNDACRSTDMAPTSRRHLFPERASSRPRSRDDCRLDRGSRRTARPTDVVRPTTLPERPRPALVHTRSRAPRRQIHIVWRWPQWSLTFYAPIDERQDVLCRRHSARVSTRFIVSVWIVAAATASPPDRCHSRCCR